MKNIFAERVEALRALMRRNGWDAVIITESDPHNSEYPAERWKQAQWISGFTGEAADIVVTLDHAGLWTDTRYFIQAAMQLEGTGIELHKTRVPDQVLIPQWLDSRFPAEAVIVIDGLCQSLSSVTELPGRFNVTSIPNLLDFLWEDRPGIPQNRIFKLNTGETEKAKISWLRKEISGKGCDAMLITALDEIAWILNIRSSDIEYNPLAIAYLYVGKNDVKLFTHETYNDIEIFLSGVKGKVLADPGTLNYHLFKKMEEGGVQLILEKSPIQLRKAVKNTVEIAGMRTAHIMDGLAMEKFLFWLERSIDGAVVVSEWDASVKLHKCRELIKGYLGDSFETISASGEGAALPHYITPKEKAPRIKKNGLYLCDSGGQFTYGTTDITRTIPMGHLTKLEKEDYTLVLKAHVDLAMAVFPKGTAGCQIDALAREPLWKAGRNFGHGTGHGVGFCLGVHEGPQDIRQNFNSTPLLPGMVISDEPGIYREGKHGVRHENLLLCIEKGSNEFGEWLGFEPLTLCHFDTSAIIPELLNQEERLWINDYNRKVYDTLGPLLPPDIANWLKGKTLPTI